MRLLLIEDEAASARAAELMLTSAGFNLEIARTGESGLELALTYGYDAILLDVDNGPEGLTRKANDALYKPSGLKNGRVALRRGGVLAVWSSGPNASFSRRLGEAGFDVNEVGVRATGRGGGAHHVIWIATRQ